MYRINFIRWRFPGSDREMWLYMFSGAWFGYTSSKTNQLRRVYCTKINQQRVPTWFIISINVLESAPEKACFTVCLKFGSVFTVTTSTHWLGLFCPYPVYARWNMNTSQFRCCLTRSFMSNIQWSSQYRQIRNRTNYSTKVVTWYRVYRYCNASLRLSRTTNSQATAMLTDNPSKNCGLTRYLEKKFCQKKAVILPNA